MSLHRIRSAVMVGVALVILVVAVMRSGMVSNLPQVVRALGRLGPGAIALILALSVVSLVLNGLLWTQLLARLGHSVPGKVGLRAFLGAGLASYVVSAAGPAIGCSLSLRKHGVCAPQAVLLTLIGNALGFCAVLFWAPAGLLVLTNQTVAAQVPLLGTLGPVIAGASLVGLWAAMLIMLRALASVPYAGGRLSRRLLGAHAQQVTEAFADHTGHTPTLRLRHLLALIPLAATAWLAGTLALYVVLVTLSPHLNPSLITVVGSTVVATELGALAFFIPDGVGVRDGVLIALLAHTTGAPLTACTAATLVTRGLDPVLKGAGLLLLSFGDLVVAQLARLSARLSPHTTAVHLPAASYGIHLPTVVAPLSSMVESD